MYLWVKLSNLTLLIEIEYDLTRFKITYTSCKIKLDC